MYLVHLQVADLHISPYESKEVNAAKASYAQGRLKVPIIHVEIEMILIVLYVPV